MESIGNEIKDNNDIKIMEIIWAAACPSAAWARAATA